MIKKFFLLFLFCLASCSAMPNLNSEIQPLPTPKRELNKDIPNSRWVKIFFEGFDVSSTENGGKTVKNIKQGGIDDVVMNNGLLNLRETVLPENDLEVRIWVGFGLYGNDGLIIKRNSDKWSAVNLREMLCHLDERRKYTIAAPKSGWETMWKKLVDTEILSLPDSSELEYDNDILDGKSFVIETNFQDIYRTYQYGNPKHHKVREAKQIMKIGEIIAEEFGLKSFSAEINDCGYDE